MDFWFFACSADNDASTAPPSFICRSITVHVISCLIVIMVTGWILWKYYVHRRLMKSVQEILEQRKLKSQEVISKLKLPTNIPHEQILSMNIHELQSAMNQNDFTSYELVSLYISRCLKFGPQFNAITQEFYGEALRKAELSDERRASGKLCRPLEGIPFSVKDCFDQKGAESFCGLASLIGKISQHDCPLITVLRNAGAIPFVRSNVPPILMAWETSNNAYGSSLNPWNTSKITGGSSGGEAVLISSRCSPVGMGTDIGGSLRIPAACCGIYSLKPTTCRLSTKLAACQEVPGQNAILSSPGPMGRCVSDLDLFMRVWLQSRHPLALDESFDHDEAMTITTTASSSSSPSHSLLNRRGLSDLWSYDPYTPPTVWRNPLTDDSPVSSRPLRIGYIPSNGFFPPARCCQRALNEAIETLKEDGHQLVQWSPPSLSFSRAGFLANQVFVADRCQWLNSVLGDEFPHFTVLGGIILGYLPPLLLSLLSRLLKAIPFTHRIGILLEHTFAHSYPSVSKVWQMNSEIKTYQNDFLENMKLSKLDFILCPTMALPAINHQQSVNLLPVVMYTSIFNILQFPVGHVPITRVQADECYYSEKGNDDLMSQLANEQMKDSQGLPVGISVIGLPYDDESVLNLMSVLEKKFLFVPSI